MNPTLCLNMIVKNESKIITRLLDSVINIIDTYCICDTGSTDNTIDIIKDYFDKKQIPGKLLNEPFKDFCYNRNYSLSQCNGMSDYILLLDADMILEANNFDKNTLNLADCFNISQGNSNFNYHNTRIIKNNGLYKYIGVTHEYIDYPNDQKLFIFDKNYIFIKDIGDGGSKDTKFQRDIKLLTEGIKNEPNNVRYYFYLANSYYDYKNYNDAIVNYKLRINMGGWREEVWYSYYRIGLCYMNLNKYPDAIYNWLLGYNYYPERLEGLYEIIKHYVNTCQYELCKLIYDLAKKYLEDDEINRDNYLFLHEHVYKYNLYFEYSIFASYLGIKNIDKEIILIMNNCTENHKINLLLSNMKFYKNVLTPINVLKLDNSIDCNINNENIKFNSSSSCLIKNNNSDGYKLNLRYVNYIIDNKGNYLNSEKHIISVNRYIEFNNNFQIIGEKFLNLPFDNRLYIGVEDIKIYYDKYIDKLLYIGTGYHSNDQIGIVYGEYDELFNSLQVNELKQEFKSTTCEKNWVLVDYMDKTHVVYSWSPLQIGTITNNKLTIKETKNMPKMYDNIRGSTCGFVYNNIIRENNDENITMQMVETEIWFVNHMVSYESPRHYYHIISVFDKNMNLLRYSAPFKFEGEPIEYCLSILVENGKVMMNYSTWDRTSRIGIYDKMYIDSLLQYK